MTSRAFLELKKVSASYRQRHKVLDSVSLSVKKGELVCLLGPSGCGKTTILRAIGGFQDLETGQIRLDGVEIANRKKALEPENRNVGMVFQDHALFPHLTVKDNIGFGLRQLKAPDKADRISELLALINLGGLEKKYPHELSGGESQRVALARALAPQPKLLLLDEPFSSLDRALRGVLGLEVRSILKKLDITAIMVTHDHQEAFTLADTVGVMANGKILQWGQPKELYQNPNSAFVAGFVGAGNLLTGQMLDNNQISTELGFLKPKANILNEYGNTKAIIDGKVQVLIADDDIELDGSSDFSAKVLNKAFKGSTIELTLELKNKERLNCIVDTDKKFLIGDELKVSLSKREYQFFKN